MNSKTIKKRTAVMTIIQYTQYNILKSNMKIFKKYMMPQVFSCNMVFALSYALRVNPNNIMALSHATQKIVKHASQHKNTALKNIPV